MFSVAQSLFTVVFIFILEFDIVFCIYQENDVKFQFSINNNIIEEKKGVKVI